MQFDRNDFKEYLGEIGVKDYGDEEIIGVLETLTDDSRLIEKIVYCLAFPEIRPDSFYSLKNKNYDISLALTSFFDYEYYFYVMEHLFKHADRIGNEVLDVGCDNGILTCYLALRFPEKRFIGIDQCNEGVSCAKKLADQLGLKNIEFICSKAAKFDRKFDTVISSTTFHENIEREFQGRFFLLDYAQQKQLAIQSFQRYSKHISDLVKDGGTFISCERIGKNPLMLGWMDALNEECLVPYFGSFDYKAFDYHGDDDNFVYMIYEKNKAILPETDIETFYQGVIMPREPNESIPLKNPSMGSLKLHKYKDEFIKGNYYLYDGIIYAKHTLWTDKRNDGLLLEKYDLESGAYMLSVINGSELEDIKSNMDIEEDWYKEQGYKARPFANMNPSIPYIMQFSKQKKIQKKSKKKKKKKR